jgi:outer membrane murein-binding lipoprotein Lpp
VILNSTENEQILMKSRKFNQTSQIVKELRRQIDALSSNKNTITEQSETLSKN